MISTGEVHLPELAWTTFKIPEPDFGDMLRLQHIAVTDHGTYEILSLEVAHLVTFTPRDGSTLEIPAAFIPPLLPDALTDLAAAKDACS